MGGSSVQLEIIKQLENIFVYIILLRFWGEHSKKVNNVKNALLFCSCFYAQVFVVNYFLIFRNFVRIEGWVGGVYRVQL